jgi:hypothetical protein
MMLMSGEVQPVRASNAARGFIRALACGACLLVLAAGCSDGVEPPTEQQPPSAPGEVETLHPAAEPLPGEAKCEVVITRKIEHDSAAHVALCSEIDYATNPPSGGEHWAKWASYKAYTVPVARPLYVHNQEHGGVVLSYRCAGECPEVVAMLQQVMDEFPDDAICGAVPQVPKRLLLAPDPEIPTPIAASAWGATYTATCLDKASLASFVSEAYGKGPEVTCANGIDVSQTNGAPAECQE